MLTCFIFLVVGLVLGRSEYDIAALPEVSYLPDNLCDFWGEIVESQTLSLPIILLVCLTDNPYQFANSWNRVSDIQNEL